MRERACGGIVLDTHAARYDARTLSRVDDFHAPMRESCESCVSLLTEPPRSKIWRSALLICALVWVFVCVTMVRRSEKARHQMWVECFFVMFSGWRALNCRGSRLFGSLLHCRTEWFRRLTGRKPGYVGVRIHVLFVVWSPRG